MDDYTQLQAVIASRVNASMADLLLAVADHFYSLAARMPPSLPPIDGMADLLILLEARYADEASAQQRAVGAFGEPPPDWLRDLADGARLPEEQRKVWERWP